jgi:hypothetical protein
MRSSVTLGFSAHRERGDRRIVNAGVGPSCGGAENLKCVPSSRRAATSRSSLPGGITSRGPVQKMTAPFTEKQGQYLAFIYAYTKLNRRPPAEVDMQTYFGVTPPTVHQMILELDKPGTPRQADWSRWAAGCSRTGSSCSMVSPHQPLTRSRSST